MKIIKFLWNILKDERGSTLTVTYSFSANTLMVASQMNTNFVDVAAIVNALTSTNFANDSVGKAALASDVIRATYGLIQHTDGSLYIDVSDTNPCLELTDGGVRVKVDDSSIERVSGGLQVKALGVTNAMLAGSIADGKMAETYHTVARHDADDHSALNYAVMGTGVLPKSRGGSGTTGDSIIKAWVNFAANGTMNGSYNVVSVVNNSTGVYTITWDVDFANTDYCVTNGAKSSGGAFIEVATKAVGTLVINVRDRDGVLASVTEVNIMAIGDQ